MKVIIKIDTRSNAAVNTKMSFSRDLRFRDHECRLQESVWARQGVPSSQDYQTVGETCLSPNRTSLAGTTFGASARSVLSPTNHTCQGKMAGFASHRRDLSPRPGPGAHRPSTVDNHASRLWIETASEEEIQEQRVKSRIKQLNFRLSGELPYETTSSKQLRERRNELCRTLKSIRSLADAPSASFSYSLDQSGTIASRGGSPPYSPISRASRFSQNTIRPETAH